MAKGKAIVNLLKVNKGEKIAAIVPVKEFDAGHHLIMATRKGMIKKTSLRAFANARSGNFIEGF